MPSFKLPGVRTMVTYFTLAVVGYAAVAALPDNASLADLREIAKMAVIFYFGTKVGEATVVTRNQ